MAEDFSWAHLRLFNGWQERVNNARESHRGRSSWIVNSAFANELILKCLLKVEDVPVKRIHNLTKLFEKLPAKTRQLITRNFTERYSKNPVTLRVISGTLNLARPGSMHIKPSFRNVLRASASSFEVFRYIYEQLGCNAYCGQFLYPVIRDVVIEKHPDFLRPHTTSLALKTQTQPGAPDLLQLADSQESTRHPQQETDREQRQNLQWLPQSSLPELVLRTEFRADPED